MFHLVHSLVSSNVKNTIFVPFIYKMADRAQTNGTPSKEQIDAADSIGVGDTEFSLQFSNLSEDMGGQNSALDLQNVSSSMADLDAHVTPIAAAQAVKSEIHDNEHGFSDDDAPKTLTTLEPMKKASPHDDGITVCHVEMVDGEHEEGTILLEVYNEDEPAIEEKELTDFQLDPLGPRVAKSKKNVKTGKRPLISTPGANISIDMQPELLMSCVKSTPRKLDNDELIAILEGEEQNDGGASDNMATYEVTVMNNSTNADTKVGLSKAEEREIAMQQIMSLPRKKKGRPRIYPTVTKAAAHKPKVTGTSNLVRSLVSDWNDDNETKTDDQSETEILVEINDNGVAAINQVPVNKNKRNNSATESEAVQPNIRRSRIIKKKIIWDPDAPETAINYASFAHTTGPGVKKRVASKKIVAAAADEAIPPVQNTAAHTSTAKKKKTSEIDKLLGDEGAINMLNSLNNQENGNGVSTLTTKSSRIKAIKTEPVEEPVAVVPPKTKATRKENTKEASPQKQSGAPKKVISPTGTGKRRGPKPAAASWDYVYSSRPDDCMIVRRRSNSSYSSTASLNRTSIDLACAPPVLDDDEPPAKRSKAGKEKLFEFTKPTPKLPIRQERASTNSNDTSKRKRGATDAKPSSTAVQITKIKKEKKNGAIDAPAAVAGFEIEQECSTTEYNEIRVKKYKTFAQIILTPLKPYASTKSDGHDTDNQTLLTAQMMKEVESNLQSLEADKACKLVLITSANSTFCSGIDCSTVLQPNGEKRRIAALELSKKLT